MKFKVLEGVSGFPGPAGAGHGPQTVHNPDHEASASVVALRYI